MHVILTGATGLIGSAVLDAMIKNKGITKISVLSRRPVQMAEDVKDPRVNVIIHNNFEQYDKELMDKLDGASGCVWALGISQTQVGKEEYIKITKDYAMAAATAFHTNLCTPAQPFHFVFVSGQGAALKPGAITPFFGRIKGETEVLLAEMRKNDPAFRASSVRPAVVTHEEQPVLAPYVPKKPVLIGAYLGVVTPLIKVFSKNSWSPTEPLGRFLTEMAMGRWEAEIKEEGRGVEKVGEFPVVNNEAIRRLCGI